MADTIVLDLDDTLYAEADYVRSGVNAVAAQLEKLYKRDIAEDLQESASSGGDWLAQACTILNLPEETKNSLLWTYRLHTPQIELERGVDQALVELGAQGHKLVLLTDGRSVTQRLKMKALGLDMPAYVSEEWGAPKPDPARYKAVERDWPSDRFVYVADNPAKDFIAPKQLGWTTIGVRLSDRSLYADGEGVQPDRWIASVADLPAAL